MDASELLEKLDGKIEELSAHVHDAWHAEKASQGFHAPIDCRSPRGPKDGKFGKTCDRCHSDMYPYDELPENVKEYDRVTVRSVLKAIKQAI